jgi:hypothetical protein
MKTLKLLVSGILLFSFFFSSGQAIIQTSRNIPAWGVPVTSERYYYLPDIETYYDIPSGQYVHLRDGNWVRSNTVPAAYRNYDFQRGRKVVINDYRGNAPYTYYNVHRVKYAPAQQQRIYYKDKHDYKHGNGLGKGHTKGHGKGHAKGRGQGHNRD